MKKTRLLMLWFLLVGTIVSCTKKDNEDPQPTPTANNDYFPTTANSSWDFVGSGTYKYVVTGATKGFGGKTFQEFDITENGANRKGYMRKENGVYYSIGMINSQTIETVFLKENAPAGESWEYTTPFAAANLDGLTEEQALALALFEGVESKMKYTMIAKGLQKTVEGKNHKDVIQVKLDISISFFGQIMPLVSVDYFFAKGVGLILADQGANGKLSLKTYVVK